VIQSQSSLRTGLKQVGQRLFWSPDHWRMSRVIVERATPNSRAISAFAPGMQFSSM
jgi:hypothetical protein